MHIFSVSFYSTFNSLYLGVTLPSNLIINYINAERLNNIAIGLYYPIVNAFIPRVMNGDKKARLLGGCVIITYSFLCMVVIHSFGSFL